MSEVEDLARANAAPADEEEAGVRPRRSRTDAESAFGGARRLVPVDLDEQSLAQSSPELLELLLSDMTAGMNIIWATDDYSHLGPEFTGARPITAASVTGPNTKLIRPRVEKSREKQGDRVKAKAEVYTPTWLCNEQNNLVDDAWFRRAGVFNTATRRGWRRTAAPIEFPGVGDRTWERYVDEPRLEAACGEAPYLVSRYDATSGEPIALERRVGLLDRKMRVVTERCRDEDQWLRWARRAFESVYGYEYYGDSLLLARENLLASYVDYARSALQRLPTDTELIAIAEVLVWNIWQMDALTGTVPFKTLSSSGREPALFEVEEDHGRPCRIRDWRANETIEFRSLMKGGGTR